MALAQTLRRFGQFGIADAPWSVRLRCGHQRPDEGHFAPQRNLDVRSTGQLEHRTGVHRDLLSDDVAGAARHCQDLGLGGGAGVEQGERIIDARIDIDDQPGSFGVQG